MSLYYYLALNSFVHNLLYTVVFLLWGILLCKHCTLSTFSISNAIMINLYYQILFHSIVMPHLNCYLFICWRRCCWLQLQFMKTYFKYHINIKLFVCCALCSDMELKASLTVWQKLVYGTFPFSWTQRTLQPFMWMMFQLYPLFNLKCYFLFLNWVLIFLYKDKISKINLESY